MSKIIPNDSGDDFTPVLSPFRKNETSIRQPMSYIARDAKTSNRPSSKRFWKQKKNLNGKNFPLFND